MASPFAIFRKYQKELMVILTGVAMFCFIFLDAVSNQSQGAPPAIFVIILAMVGAGIAWIHGVRTNKSSSYWLNGAVVGAVVGLAVTLLNRTSESGVATSLGKLSQREIIDLKRRREVANHFISLAFRERENPIGFLLQSYVFGDTNTRDVLAGYLLQHEADTLGVQLTDEFVTKYINEVSENRLSPKKFREFRGMLGLGESELYDILRGELRARVAFQVTNPEMVYLPHQYWQDYQKFNVRHTIDATAIPVEAFAKQIESPAEGELKAFFEAHRQSFPVGENPGFRQPDKKRLAYLTADFEQVEKEVGEISEDELKKLYEERKDTLYKTETLPDPTPKGSKSEADTVEKKSDEPADETKSPTEKPADEKSTPPAEKTDKKDEAPQSEAKPSDKSDGKNADGDQDDEDQGDADANQDASQTTAESQPAEKTEKPAETKPEPDKQDAKSASEAPPEPESKAPAGGKDEPSTGDKSDSATATPGATKYKPFEEVRDELRDTLLREKTQQLLKQKMEQAMTVISELRFKLKDETPDISDTELAKHVSAKAQAHAKEHGLEFVETPLLTFTELSESKDYKLGTAREPFNQEQLMRGVEQQTVPQRVFGGASTPFIPELAESATGDQQFVYWVIESVDSHEPEFTEPGIREQVEKAWRMQKARPKAQERADALAKIVRESIAEKSMAEALGEQTVTGESESVQLSVITSPPFTWLRQGFRGMQMNPFAPPPIEFGVVPGIDNINDEFMSAIAEMPVKEVKVVSNADKTVWYVVHLKNRTPEVPNQPEFKAMQQQFINEDVPMSPIYRNMAASQISTTQARWLADLMAKYAVDVTALDEM